MKFLDIFVPVDLNRFEAQVRAKVRSYFLFIFFVICLATFLMKFFQAYAEADGTQIFMCALTAFFYLLLVLVIWICVSALIRFTPVVYRKIAGALKKKEQENAIPSQQVKDTPLPESPFRGEKAESPGFAPNRPQPFFGQGFGHGRGPVFGPEAQGPRGDRFPRRGRFSPDMPQEVRAKVVEAAKLRIDLEEVLSQKPLNREKALELNGKISKLKQEIRAWRFEQKLDRIEEFNKKLAEDAGKPEEK